MRINFGQRYFVAYNQYAVIVDENNKPLKSLYYHGELRGDVFMAKGINIYEYGIDALLTYIQGAISDNKYKIVHGFRNEIK